MEFTMSQYMNAEELYKAKSEYYHDLSDELQQEIDELKAHVKRLSEALYFIAQDYPTDNPKYLHPYAVAEEALEQTASQSLNHIKSQVEEEIREKFKKRAREVGLLSIEDIDETPRKYKEQSDEGGE